MLNSLKISYLSQFLNFFIFQMFCSSQKSYDSFWFSLCLLIQEERGFLCHLDKPEFSACFSSFLTHQKALMKSMNNHFPVEQAAERRSVLKLRWMWAGHFCFLHFLFLYLWRNNPPPITEENVTSSQ